MKVKVLFFAGLRELAGKSQMSLELKEGETVALLLEKLQSDFPGLISGQLMLAVNAEYAPRDHKLKDGDEVALIPPVSGG